MEMEAILVRAGITGLQRLIPKPTVLEKQIASLKAKLKTFVLKRRISLTGRQLYFADIHALAMKWHKAARVQMTQETHFDLMKKHSQSFQHLPQEIIDRYERAAQVQKTRMHQELTAEEESMWNKLYLLKEQQAQQEDLSTEVSCL